MQKAALTRNWCPCQSVPVREALLSKERAGPSQHKSLMTQPSASKGSPVSPTSWGPRFISDFLCLQNAVLSVNILSFKPLAIYRHVLCFPLAHLCSRRTSVYLLVLCLEADPALSSPL